MQFEVSTSKRQVLINGHPLHHVAARHFACCLARRADQAEERGLLVDVANQFTLDEGHIEPADAYLLAGRIFNVASQIAIAVCAAGKLSTRTARFTLAPVEADEPAIVAAIAH